MFKKGLVTLVCLTVMSALWAWAATTYSISTKITSIGTVKQADGSYKQIVGGDIKVRGGDAQTYGIKYSNFTTQELIDVVVDPIDGYKISALTATGPGVDTLPAVGAKQTDALTVKIKKPGTAAVGTAAWVVATFAPDSDTVTVTQNWQLQVLSNTKGGRMLIERATDNAVTYTTFGKSLVKSYVDTTPVKVTVTPDSGWDIDYLIVDGKKTFYKSDDVQVVNVNPAVGSRIKSVVAGFKKQSLLVTTQKVMETRPTVDGFTVTRPVPNGIEPANPVADPSGTARLVVTPTGSNNKVTGITVSNTDTTDTTLTATWKYYDRFGKELTTLAGHIGPVKVTISNITEPITVAATYGVDVRQTAAYNNCTQTCHLTASAAVQAADTQWLGSTHADNPYHTVDCVGCHQTMPGPALDATLCKGCHAGQWGPKLSAGHDAGASCLKCHNEHSLEPVACATCHTNYDAIVAEANTGHHATATGHLTNACQRCHTTEGAIQGANTGWTGSYTNYLSVNTYTPVTATDGVKCDACHDHHSGLRIVKTGTATWDPNQNAKNDQYDLCTSCHTVTDNSGALTDMYHEKSSMDATRILSDSHVDNAATGTVANVGTTVEGYVIRANSANPCADCHNLHTADLTVQEQWAKSGHAGGIAKAKADAVCAPALAWFNVTFPANTAGACTDVKSVTMPGSTRVSTASVSELYGKTAEGIAALKAAGATDATGVAWTHYDWDKTLKADGVSLDRGDCQRCHTATGVANFLEAKKAGTAYDPKNNNFSHLSGWTAVAGSPQQELLYCWGCHSDSQTGALRNPGALTLDYSANANDTVIYPNVGASNVCIACHSGNGGSGNTIKNQAGDFNAMGAIQPHYLAAAGTLMGRTGYEFAGVTYTDGYHKNLGVGNFKGTGTSGPCVACHMTGTEKHTFEVSANATCAKCHEGLTDATLEAAKEEYNAAVEELNVALKAKGIWFIPNYPYFVADNGCVATAADSACTSYDPLLANDGQLTGGEALRANGFKKWEDAVPGTNGKDTMGAAFNFNLLVHEPGAFAHNRTYAYQLIASSIDFLNDGIVDPTSHSNVVPANKALTALQEERHIDVAFQENICSTCHAPSLPAPAANIGAGMASVHAVGQAEATPTFTVNGADLEMTFTPKLDGVNATGYSVNRVVRFFDDSANGNGWVSYRYAASQFSVSQANGAITVKILGGAANANSRYMVRLMNAAGKRIVPVGNYPASPVDDKVSNEACTNCHGGKIPVHDTNPLTFEVCVVCHGADKTTTGGTTYAASTYPKLPYLLHGIHASEKVMPSGKFTFGGEDFKVAYPTYLNNCSVCHIDSADLATVTAKPVSYAFCMTCHENFTGFDHGNTVFGGQEHAGYTAATDCQECHAGKTVNNYHNGLLTERAGVIWNGVDTSITEGAKINTTINSVERVGGNLVIKWAATFNGTAVDPCYGPSDAVDKPSWQNANNPFSVLRAYSLGDDWANAGISTSPGQPASTNIAFADDLTKTPAVYKNTVCADNVATTTIALSTAEKTAANVPAGTKVAIALQGKVNLFNANTNAPQGVRAKTAYQAYQFQTTDGALTTYNRRDVTDTNNCLKCHPGSLYQHGGNRIDSMELCVMCHNETSSEQNVRLLDGVDATEAYDGKVGQTYGFKTLLHALHSATENDAITMIYRTNGNYVFTGEEGQPAHYPTGDVFADDAAYVGMSWFTADDNATLAQEVGTGSAALIFGSSAAHGTGPQTAGTMAPYYVKADATKTPPVAGVAYTAGTKYQVYRAHNIIRVTYPQDLKNCTACHKDGGYNIPSPAVATPTVVDAGTVGLGGTAPAQTAANSINSNIADDLVIGATTAACMSCHNANAALEPAKKTWLDNHAKNFGYAPVLRANAGTESCTTCHKP